MNATTDAPKRTGYRQPGRIFIHPACAPGTDRHEMLIDGLAQAGIDINKHAVVDRGLGLLTELVEVVERTGNRVLLRRFDTTMYSKEVADAVDA